MTGKLKDGWRREAHHDELHTIPEDDVIEHEFDDCACQPNLMLKRMCSVSMIWLCEHRAWDGRKGPQ